VEELHGDCTQSGHAPRSGPEAKNGNSSAKDSAPERLRCGKIQKERCTALEYRYKKILIYTVLQGFATALTFMQDSGVALTRRWALQTCYTLRRNAARKIKQLVWFISI